VPSAALLLLVVVLGVAVSAEAQDLEPRAFNNAPVGLNFLILGYGYTQGDVAFDSSSPIKDAQLTVHGAALGYARALDVFGMAGKFDALLPFASLNGTAKVFGEERERQVSGLGDPRVRFSLLWYGAPALTLEEFADYKADFIIGSSLAVTLPLGQYDTHKLVNIGTHRWSFKPEIGISKTLGPLTLELATSATFYTVNDDFFVHRTLKTDPLFAVQAHVIYHTRVGLWMAVDTTYYAGGKTTVDGEEGERNENVRVGLTIAVPIDRHNSVKLYGSTGAVARVGGSFNAAGIAWQYRWGGGL